MSKVLTSLEAADILCEKDRTNFIVNAALLGYFTICGGSLLVPLLYSIIPAFIWVLIALISYLFIAIVASIIMHFRHDGKYWNFFSFQPTWYDSVYLFQKRMFTISDLSEISNYSGEWILINGVRLKDLLLVSSKWCPTDYEGYEKYSWEITINLNGIQCAGSFRTIDKDIAAEKLIDEKIEYLIIGKVQNTSIIKLKAMKALLSNTEYNKEYINYSNWLWWW